MSHEEDRRSNADPFGDAAVVRADAPGRVNVIGEHTDYNGGFVLPTVIPQRTHVEAFRVPGDRVEVVSTSFPGAPQTYTLGAEERRGTWVDYVQAVTWVLRVEGHPVPAFQARIHSDVPIGSGLSSSASLQVALLRALFALGAGPGDDVAIARLAHRAEREFVGAPVGMMDQMAVSLADEGAVLFIDTRSGTFERIALPRSIDLCVIDSGVAHEHASGEYRVRRAECEAAARALGVVELRDVLPEHLDRVERLPPPLDRRARHVVTENQRVIEAALSLRLSDVERLGVLMDASHRSMRDDFEISVPTVDALVESLRGQPQVLGARMTGGGFGGAVVALVRRGAARDVARTALNTAKRAGKSGVRRIVPGGES